MGVCFGIFVGYFIAGMSSSVRGVNISKKFVKLGNLQGRSLDEIVAKVGDYTTVNKTIITDRNNAPGYLYTWTTVSYTITLLFDEYNYCIGVTDERAL